MKLAQPFDLTGNVSYVCGDPPTATIVTATGRRTLSLTRDGVKAIAKHFGEYVRVVGTKIGKLVTVESVTRLELREADSR